MRRFLSREVPNWVVHVLVGLLLLVMTAIVLAAIKVPDVHENFVAVATYFGVLSAQLVARTFKDPTLRQGPFVFRALGGAALVTLALGAAYFDWNDQAALTPLAVLGAAVVEFFGQVLDHKAEKATSEISTAEIEDAVPVDRRRHPVVDAAALLLFGVLALATWTRSSARRWG